MNCSLSPSIARCASSQCSHCTSSQSCRYTGKAITSCQRLERSPLILSSRTSQQEAFRFALTESADVECQSPEHESSAIWIRLAMNYTEACYNLADLFQQDFGFGTDNKSTCLFEDAGCDREWEARMPENWDAAGNFSYMSWMVATNPGEWSGFPNYDPADVTVRVFEGEDCREMEGGNPFYQWGGCEKPANDCVQLPFGIGSFRVMRTPEDNKSDGCLVGAERGAAVPEFSLHLTWLFACFFGAVVLLG
jgi:hypothetical protein